MGWVFTTMRKNDRRNSWGKILNVYKMFLYFKGIEDYTQEVHKGWRNVVLISFNQPIFSVAQSSFINSSRLVGYKNKNYLWFFSLLRPLYYVYTIPKSFYFHHFLLSTFFSYPLLLPQHSSPYFSLSRIWLSD